MTAIRGGDGRLFVSVDGRPLQTSSIMQGGGLLPLDRPQRMLCGSDGTRVTKLRYGAGWPTGAERLHVRKGVY